MSTKEIWPAFFYFVTMIGGVVFLVFGLEWLFEKVEDPSKRSKWDKIGAVILIILCVVIIIRSFLWVWEHYPVPWL